jgi:hypothetical protein
LEPRINVAYDHDHLHLINNRRNVTSNRREQGIP